MIRFALFRRLRHALVPALALLALTGCADDITVYGYVPHQQDVDRIEVGKSSRRDVRQTLGAPFTQGTFEESRWFYIERRTRIRGILEPELVDQRVLVVEFDEASGKLAATRMYTVDDALNVRPVDRVTVTLGKEQTIIQEVLGNIGRFAGGNAPTQ